MKVTIEIDLPEGQEIPLVSDILTLTNPDWLVDRWHIQDVKDNNEWLTDEQAREVLEMVGRRRDCNVGINWSMIESIVCDEFPNPEWEEE
jgi:hypothetical protein